MISLRFSGSSGLGSWPGNSPFGTKYSRSSVVGNESMIGPIMGPAIPLPPSSTRSMGRIASGSMNPST